jgi:hypothetical protein
MEEQVATLTSLQRSAESERAEISLRAKMAAAAMISIGGIVGGGLASLAVKLF